MCPWRRGPASHLQPPRQASRTPTAPARQQPPTGDKVTRTQVPRRGHIPPKVRGASWNPLEGLVSSQALHPLPRDLRHQP